MVTALSPSVSTQQKNIALDLAKEHGFNHRIIKTSEMENENYTRNPAERCYFCKSELYTKLSELRHQLGVEVIFDGNNADDLKDYRPGRKAASEGDVVSPLVEVDIHKEEIRRFSRRWKLSTWNQPAMPCLSSRFPYGVQITETKLHQVEQAEAFLRTLGLRNFRVRHHENLARIEVDPSEIPSILELGRLQRINTKFKAFGYHYVTLDLQGYRSGSLNELLSPES